MCRRYPAKRPLTLRLLSCRISPIGCSKLSGPCAFDLLMLNGKDLRRRPYVELRAALHVEQTEGDGVEMFKAVCKLGLEGIVSKKLDWSYKSGASKAWLKIKNPDAPAATRVIDGTF